jgi:hypothetical protein
MIRSITSSLFPYIYLEITMIVRNKKPLNNLFQILLLYIFSIFILILTYNKSLNTSLMFLMVLSLMNSSFVLGHGVFLLTWESTYFSFLMTHKISLQSFFRAKYVLFILSAIILSFINIPLILIVKSNIWLYLSFLVFNVGVLPLLVVVVAFFNNERADLDRSILLNYEGYGMWQYTILIFELMLPGFIYIGISSIWSVYGALFILCFLGILGIMITTFFPCLFFLNRKYQIIHGFNTK